MKTVRELAEEAWAGALDLTGEYHPLKPLLRHGEEIAVDVLWIKGTATVNVIDTGAGLVALDAGKAEEGARIHAEVRRWRPESPLVAAVFSHHHIDHIGGLGPFDAEGHGGDSPTVYGHERIAGNLDRYRRTRELNASIRSRQSGTTAYRGWPPSFRLPDITHGTRSSFRVGNLTFELHAALGETDDQTWTWIPERGILHAGDLFIWAVPNAGNPQKVQRYPGAWAAALRSMAETGATTLLPGHGFPIFGAERVRRALEETAEFLESLEQQTIDLMNAGASLDEIIQKVAPPPWLMGRPYLQPIYDRPEFIVRNVWRQFGGWYEGHADTLMPAARSEKATEWIGLAGGIDSVLARAAALRDQGRLALASHLIEEAMHALPAHPGVNRLRSEIYEARAEGESALIARNIFRHAAASSREGLRDVRHGAEPRVSRV